MRRQNHTYVSAFDGLRGIAILPVVLLHVGVSTLPPDRLLFELTRGWYGVDLFFVLSGFLITWILTAEMRDAGTIDLRGFYRRRVLRLGPAYVSMLSVVLIGAAFFEPQSLRKLPHVLPSILTFTYNYQIAAGGEHFDLLVVVWSLCVEEQFYLVWPFVLRYLGRDRALRFCAGAIGLLTIYRIALYGFLNWPHLGQPTAASSIWIYFATDTRIGVILTGCAAALLVRDSRARGLVKWMRNARLFPYLAFAAACLLAVFVTGARPSSASWRSATFGYALCAFAAAALIVALMVQQRSLVARSLSWKPLVSLGKVSYGVYLFHPAVMWTLLRIHQSMRLADTAALPPAGLFAALSVLVLGVTWLVAALHFRYVEKWFLSLRTAPQCTASVPSERRLENFTGAESEQ
ncbi:MAG TPA: acyltransferase [Candidatus Binataceae bacterium]|nr:acyltransferase [Candidatus Binataceae bacterium]